MLMFIENYDGNWRKMEKSSEEKKNVFFFALTCLLIGISKFHLEIDF